VRSYCGLCRIVVRMPVTRALRTRSSPRPSPTLSQGAWQELRNQAAADPTRAAGSSVHSNSRVQSRPLRTLACREGPTPNSYGESGRASGVAKIWEPPRKLRAILGSLRAKTRWPRKKRAGVPTLGGRLVTGAGRLCPILDVHNARRDWLS